jgi:hypothetical protein
MCSSHSTGCERTCVPRSKISAQFGSSSLKLRKVPTVPWQEPLATKTVSPFRNVRVRKRSGVCRAWNRSILFRPFWQETSGTDGFRGPEEISYSALGGDADFSMAGLRHGSLIGCTAHQLLPPPASRYRIIPAGTGGVVWRKSPAGFGVTPGITPVPLLLQRPSRWR